MRSLFSMGTGEQWTEAVTGVGHRSEVLRRKTLANNARLLVAAAALSLPFAVVAAMLGTGLPFAAAVVLLATGMAAMSFHNRRDYENAAAAEVHGLMLCGVVMAFADPRLGDAGMAVMLMGPILASLAGSAKLRSRSWRLVLVGFALAGIAALPGMPTPVMPEAVLLGLNLGGFAVAVGVVAHTGNRIGSAYEVYDKAQVTAYRHLIEHVEDAVIRFSSDGEVLMASRSSERLFGCPRYLLNGAALGERLHVLDRPAYLTAFADANLDGRSRRIEVRMRQDDPHAVGGATRFIWVEINLSPVADHEAPGLRREVIAVMRDVTERKDAEAAMADARREAEEASEAKSRFLATIGHELRTPLNAVVGFSEMMTSGIGGQLSETHREYAGLIHQSGKHLLEVVRMLLDMSRIEAGKFELQTDSFQLGDIVEPCFAMVDATARDRSVQLVADIAPNLPMLNGDERACRQILLNLLSNAVKFSHEGGRITVSLKRQGQSLNLSVTDTGIGMAPESLKRIGEPFFQADNGLDRKHEGTGLGLSIVKGLAELHGGTLRAMSEIGAGTTVTVLLPINGPSIKTEETAVVTPIRRETVPSGRQWQDEKRKAQ